MAIYMFPVIFCIFVALLVFQFSNRNYEKKEFSKEENFVLHMEKTDDQDYKKVLLEINNLKNYVKNMDIPAIYKGWICKSIEKETELVEYAIIKEKVEKELVRLKNAQ